jgi:succinate dehydrogenase cytochrome b556 subunit
MNVVRIGGLEAFADDIRIPLKYGVDQCVGDTICAGGILYGQRGIPAMLDFCRDIREVAEEGALLLNYANPMAMMTWAALDAGVRTVGLCHGVQNGHRQIARALGVPMGEVDVVCSGINHQTWYTDIRHEGRKVGAEELLAALARPLRLPGSRHGGARRGGAVLVRGLLLRLARGGPRGGARGAGGHGPAPRHGARRPPRPRRGGRGPAAAPGHGDRARLRPWPVRPGPAPCASTSWASWSTGSHGPDPRRPEGGRGDLALEGARRAHYIPDGTAKGRPMADVNRGNRPLSPFMLGTHYRIQWTSASSLLTRITGNALIVGTVLVVWWLLALSVGPGPFALADGVIRSWFGDLVLLGSLWALWYHLLAGLRHLVWSTGRMLEIHTAETFAKVITVGSFVLTALTVAAFWWLA